MKAATNGSRLAIWRTETIAGYRVAWAEAPDGRASVFCVVDLPSGRNVHLDPRGPLFLAELHVGDVYEAADAYVAIVSECFGWRTS